ncbi:hypothetical protein [Rasiella sp. SM2506]
MLKFSNTKKSKKYANIDMDKFKFDFNLFVPSEKENNNPTDKNPSDI